MHTSASGGKVNTTDQVRVQLEENWNFRTKQETATIEAGGVPLVLGIMHCLAIEIDILLHKRCDSQS